MILQDTQSGGAVDAIGAAANTDLTITGTIEDDPYPLVLNPVPTTLPANLSKVGQGTVTLDPLSAGGNTYTGSTEINQGILNAENSHALGYNTSAVEDLVVTGTTGKFQLSFNSNQFEPSTPLSVGGKRRSGRGRHQLPA